MIKYDGARQRYDTALKPPSGLENPASYFPGEGSAIDPVGAGFLSVNLRWANSAKRDHRHKWPVTLVDPAGRISGRPRGNISSRRHVFSVSRPKSADPRFGILDVDSKSDRAQVRIFDQRLDQKITHTISRPREPTVHRIGSYLDLVDNNSKHHIRRTDKKFTRVETVDTRELPACSTKTREYIDGDDDRVVLYCGHTVYVRPVT